MPSVHRAGGSAAPRSCLVSTLPGLPCLWQCPQLPRRGKQTANCAAIKQERPWPLCSLGTRVGTSLPGLGSAAYAMHPAHPIGRPVCPSCLSRAAHPPLPPVPPSDGPAVAPQGWAPPCPPCPSASLHLCVLCSSLPPLGLCTHALSLLKVLPPLHIQHLSTRPSVHPSIRPRCFWSTCYVPGPSVALLGHRPTQSSPAHLTSRSACL